MSNALNKLCDVVAEVAMANAVAVRDKFSQLMPGINDTDRANVLTTLVFMNWTFASGVWSTLSNTRMRRDLQVELKEALIHRLARALSETSLPADVAASSVELADGFKAYVQAYNSKTQAVAYADSGIAALFALERIKEACGLSDAAFNTIVPNLIPAEGLAAEVESVAGEVNKVASQERGGFLSRIFQGR